MYCLAPHAPISSSDTFPVLIPYLLGLSSGLWPLEGLSPLELKRVEKAVLSCAPP